MLILAPHADDEAVGVGGWITRHKGPITIAYLTDGAPRDVRWRAPGFPSLAVYRERRREEAANAWRGHSVVTLAFCDAADQDLSVQLASAESWLRALTARISPQLILTPAFEGGHPDHDAANLLAARLSQQQEIKAWEYALYTARQGSILRQTFPESPRWNTRISAAAAAAKRMAIAAYTSQRATLADFDVHQEALRPLPRHDYRQRACLGPCVYELWGWPWRGEEIAARFAAFLDANP